ncbi:hypothetical protein ACJ73_07837 [Blastomyces percursus]|uniref:Uncharacterized protein n=1 Tax=Blastomyces percursus TaxID=1658174 RepID=A0A1J9QKT0_9EURO|nr:hypothetical protein ACJ73_07837 [Blastomyces percursus]
MTGRPASIPKFTDLPLNKGDPPFSAWGLYGKAGQLGFLNRQNDAIVAEATKEIKTGVRGPSTLPSRVRDGLRHFGYQKEKRFYNGVAMEDIHGSKDSTVNGIRAWAEKGVVGRGVLLDFHKWALANNIPAEAFKRTPIPLKYLQAVAESQGTEIKFGDILIIGVGGTMLASSSPFPYHALSVRGANTELE